MARQARAQLADMRAMEEQAARQQMHGGQFYGAGATPSMGLSQFRGGASHKCPDCRRKKCVCEESSSDEEMAGGAGLASLYGLVGDATSAVIRGIRGIRGIRSTPRIPPSQPGSALVPYNPGQAAFTSNSAFRNYALNRMFNQPSTALAVRQPGVLKVYSPDEAAARIRAAQAAGETNATVAQRLARMGVTPARVSAALALGIPAIALAIYFSEVDGDPDAGYYNPGTVGPGPGPGGPGGGDPDDPDIPGTGNVTRRTRGRRATGEGVATGNLADEYYAAQMMGSGRGGARPPKGATLAQQEALNKRFAQMNSGARERAFMESLRRRFSGRGGGKSGSNPRAEIVKQVMREQGLSLPAASKYVKDNGLY